jgi:LuxR family maltose regulon positive regulatory protein
MLGFAYGWAGAGDLVKAQQAFSEAMKISQAAGNIYYQIYAGACLGAAMTFRCKFKEATDICRQSLNLAIENGIEQTGIVGSLYGTLGMILCELNDLDEGIRLIKKGIELSKQGRDPVMLGNFRICLQRALMYRMDLAGALKVMETLNESTREFMLPPWITNTISALNVYIWLASGDLNAALQWVKERKLSIDDTLDNMREVEYLAFIPILITQKQLDDADRLLQRLIENAKAGDRVYMMIEMRLWRALIFKAKQDIAAALGELKIALSLADSGGPSMMFVSKGKPIAELLEEIIAVKKGDHDASKAGFSLSYVKKILSAFKAATPPKIEGLMDPISQRELEVLQLIASGLSNREIADKLFISLNTVKTHTKNINSKLNVNSRTKAVVRSKEIGIL